jgi:hypothetical protein
VFTGRFVALLKLRETDADVEYQFGDGQTAVGRLRLLKSSGTVELLEAPPDMDEGELRFFFLDLATFKLLRCHAAGEYPEETYAAT